MEVLMTPSPDPSQTELAAHEVPLGTSAIETYGLSKHFGQRKAVDGLTIRIPAGSIAGFVGPNGCVGYMGYPFQKWTFLLFISAVSRSCGMHR
jgi:ATPase subunit of ABC transporter with duplicated ATPase domains